MHPGAVPIPSGWARYCISISENHCWCKVYEFGYNQCYCFWRCAPGPSPRSPAICPAIPSDDASALVAFHSYPDMVRFDPYSGGPTFFGHARCTANLSDEIRNSVGWPLVETPAWRSPSTAAGLRCCMRNRPFASRAFGPSCQRRPSPRNAMGGLFLGKHLRQCST